MRPGRFEPSTKSASSRFLLLQIARVLVAELGLEREHGDASNDHDQRHAGESDHRRDQAPESSQATNRTR